MPTNTPDAIAKTLRRSAEVLARYGRNVDFSSPHRRRLQRATKKAERYADKVLAGDLAFDSAVLIRRIILLQVQLAQLSARAGRMMRGGREPGAFWHNDCFAPSIVKMRKAATAGNEKGADAFDTALQYMDLLAKHSN